MSEEHKASSEVKIIIVSVIVIVFSLLGSLATGLEPLAFLFSGILFFLFLGVIGLFCGVIGALLWTVIQESRKADGRPFLVILKEDYNMGRVFALYGEAAQYMKYHLLEAWEPASKRDERKKKEAEDAAKDQS